LFYKTLQKLSKKDDSSQFIGLHERLIVTTVASCFSPLTAECDGFHRQTARKIPIRFGVHFSAILSSYNGMTAYICRRLIPTTAF